MQDRLPSVPLRAARRVAFNVALFLVAVAVALIVGEVAVRLIAPQQLILKRPDIWRAQEGVGWIKRPGIATRVNRGEGTVRVFTDRDGYRTGPGGRVEAEKRILLLGDSFMEALQVEYRESLPGRLEERLPQLVGQAVAVRNSAVGGWGPSQYLLQARSALAEEDFDLVMVALYLGNDVVENHVERFPPRPPEDVHRFRLPGSLKWSEWIDAVFYPINDFLEVRSHLFTLMKRQTDALLMRLGLTAAYFPRVLRKGEADSERWSVTAEICEEIAELAAAEGTPTLFLLLPAPIQVDRESLRQYMEGFGIDPSTVEVTQPNRLLGQALRDRSLELVDVLPALRAAHRDGRKLYGSVDRHFNEAGHRTVAELVAPVVADYLSEDAGRASGSPVRARSGPSRSPADTTMQLVDEGSRGEE